MKEELKKYSECTCHPMPENIKYVCPKHWKPNGNVTSVKPSPNKTEENLEKLISDEKIYEAIDVALSAPFPQIALHHLIDKVIEIHKNIH